MRNEELKWQLEKIDKKHYSMISGKEKEFGIELSDNLPYIPRDNIKEAKVALEANAPTAAAMVALRAAEYSILDWYEFKTGEEPRTISWYHLIKELEENSDLEVDEEVISKVYYLRETRNKIMHAEKDVSSSEARRIISDIIDLIDYIYSNMGEVRGGTR